MTNKNSNKKRMNRESLRYRNYTWEVRALINQNMISGPQGPNNLTFQPHLSSELNFQETAVRLEE